MISFFVPGVPKTKGSWRPVKTRGGKIRLLPQTKEKPWAQAVAWAAKVAGVKPIVGPVLVRLICYFDKPKRPAYSYPSRGDVDKLARSVLDALQGIAYTDDSQVTELHISKHWATEKRGMSGPGVDIEVG